MKYSYFLHGLVAVLIISFCVSSSASQQRSATIRGRVADAETGNPLADAVVFLNGTPYGVSTGSDGAFTLPAIPPGSYDLVCSRIGYERSIKSVNLVGGDSISFVITLRPQPVRTREMEISGEGAGEMRTQPLFVPKPSPDTYCLFESSSLPVGIFFTDSATYVYALDIARIDTLRYVRLWLMYKNISQSPYDLNPANTIHLNVWGSQGSSDTIPPARPSSILRDIDNRSIVEMISNVIGKTLASKSAIHRTLEIRNSRSRWGYDFDWGTSLAMLNPAVLYNDYTNSTNDGILKRHLVYPGASVHGYLYFPLPEWNNTPETSTIHLVSQYHYAIELRTQVGLKTIEFVPH